MHGEERDNRLRATTKASDGVGTWRVGGRIQGDRRHAGVPGDRVRMRMLMVRMGERLRLLVRGVIGVKRFVACHQRVQHVQHHLRRCRDAATRRLTDIVSVRADDYARRLPRRPRRLDARDARRDVLLTLPLPPGAHSSTRTYSRRCTSAFVQPICLCVPGLPILSLGPNSTTITITVPWVERTTMPRVRPRFA